MKKIMKKADYEEDHEKIAKYHLKNAWILLIKHICYRKLLFYFEEKIMTVAFRTVSIEIPGGSERKSIESAAVFSSSVLSAGVALNGFALQYDDNDENVLLVEADTDLVSISGNTVNFKVECNLRDNSGSESYSGYVTALIMADLS